MNHTSSTELAPRIDGAVAAVDGVCESYSARAAAARAVERVIAPGATALAHVRESADARDVTVCIGVSGQTDSASVASAVASAVRGVEPDGVATHVRVRVARLVAPSA
ncbi:hypothetical protein [Microbacterium sp. LMI1-1-1.1]|uniref:hypothetical protein n=1 Tax=unclassified Microbacterium TaxID=2609290 RepID=UPI001F898855|nr:hypothetical protein [Actinomycetota bacterium]